MKFAEAFLHIDHFDDRVAIQPGSGLDNQVSGAWQTDASYAGAVYLVGSEGSISSCLFVGNFAPFGGAIAFDVGAPAAPT